MIKSSNRVIIPIPTPTTTEDIELKLHQSGSINTSVLKLRTVQHLRVRPLLPFDTFLLQVQAGLVIDGQGENDGAFNNDLPNCLLPDMRYNRLVFV